MNLTTIQEGIIINGKTTNKMLIFDLDDTLILSDAKIKVLDTSGNVIKILTPADYNHYIRKSSDLLNFDDFLDFGILKNSTFTKYFKTLKTAYAKGIHITILTARGDAEMIRQFFKDHNVDIHPELCIAIGDPKLGYVGEIAERKQEAIKRLIEKGYNDFVFFDDNEDNLKAAKEILKLYKTVSIRTVKV